MKPLKVARAAHGSDHYTIGDGPPFPGVAKNIQDARLYAASAMLLEALQELRYACTDKAERMADEAISAATEQETP